MIDYRIDGTVLLTRDDDETIQQVLPAEATDQEKHDAIMAFFKDQPVEQ